MAKQLRQVMMAIPEQSQGEESPGLCFSHETFPTDGSMEEAK